MYVNACFSVCVLMCASGFVRAITSTFMHGFQNNFWIQNDQCTKHQVYEWSCIHALSSFQLRQDKCSQRLPITSRPRTFGFSSYQLINNYMTKWGLNGNVSREEGGGGSCNLVSSCRLWCSQGKQNEWNLRHVYCFMIAWALKFYTSDFSIFNPWS